jgi:hypothetical protein
MVTKKQRVAIFPDRSLGQLQRVAQLLPNKLPPIKLRYGQVMWLLTELGYGGAVSRTTFHEYMRSLRKLGIPFGRVKFQTKHRRRLAEHSYCHVMELAVTLSLRVYHVVPDSVLRGVIRYRSRLHRLYRRAYAQRCSGPGRPIVIKIGNRKPIELRGLFLDLGIRFSGGHLVRFGPPKLLSSSESLRQFSQGAGPFRPMSLSLLSERIIALALRAPDIRSGPHMRPEDRLEQRTNNVDD